jgi:hypothetical protein
MANETTSLRELKRDIRHVSLLVNKFFGGHRVDLESMKRSLSEISQRLDTKIRDDAQASVGQASEIGAIRGLVNRMVADIDTLKTEMKKLEDAHSDMREATGRHDIVADVLNKDKDRAIEKKRISRDEKKDRNRFWIAIATVALPGLLSLIWQLFHLSGSPPPVPHVELPESEESSGPSKAPHD